MKPLPETRFRRFLEAHYPDTRFVVRETREGALYVGWEDHTLLKPPK